MREFWRREGPAVLVVLVGFVRVWRAEPLRFEVPSTVVMVVDMLSGQLSAGGQSRRDSAGHTRPLK